MDCRRTPCQYSGAAGYVPASSFVLPGMIRLSFRALVIVLLAGMAGEIQSADLVDVSVLDKDFLIVRISDGDVIHHEGATGEEIIRYLPELDTSAAAETGSWTITSTDDGNYSVDGQHPLSCYRKKKLSGHGQMEWIGGDFRYEYTYEHWIYLELPSSLQQGMEYTLEISSATNSDSTSEAFTFDVYNNRSEAVHANLVGYASGATHKAADLYCWMGDGGARNYSTFQGNTVWVYDVGNSQAFEAGEVSYWMDSGSDVGGYDLTRSAVWNVDFSSFSTPGNYRLVIDGVGSSEDFEIADDIYEDPFKVSVLGYYYMRIGEDNPGMMPPPRAPTYIPGTGSPPTTVYLTTMHPWHDDWDTFASGDKWDRKEEWAAYRKPGYPTNPVAYGGHSDAADWDRHLGHVVNIYDILLPYILADGAISDDDTGIAESGNGIPDIIDEARNEVDFWLRLRDDEGAYSHGLNNPDDNNVFYQAGPTAIAAWANAANAAMLADAFRVAGLTTLMDFYEDEAATAYTFANSLADPMLDEGLGLDDGTIRGRDFKMMAAAFLYNVTDDQAWENVVNAESVCSVDPAELLNNSRNQIWGTAAYLVTPRTVHYSTLQNNMKTQVVNEAKTEEANRINSRPSRRATDPRPGYWRTAQHVSRTMIAHTVTTSSGDKDLFHKALALEADWGLGRNPMNIIEMTTAFTPLASKRSVQEAYTSGMDDGVAGVHPGHTPYANLDDWAPGMTMGRPSALYEASYPMDVTSTWPRGETYFPSRWVWAHNEFTPRQTMRGKMALYGYLYGLAEATPPEYPTLTVTKTSVAGGAGTVTSSPAGIDCGDDCTEDYSNGTPVTLTASSDAGSNFAGWSGACFGAQLTCNLIMTMNRSVTATFAPIGLTYTLTVTRTGTGGGTVTSSPAGINCGGDCSEPYLSGTPVTLTATADGDSAFTGWGGACSGTGTCIVAMNAARSVTAEFRSTSVNTVVIYDDALADGWASWSWGGTFDLAGTDPVHSGTNAVNATLGGYGGFSPATQSAVIDTYGYGSIAFWVHGGTESDQLLSFYTQEEAISGAPSTAVDVTAVANTWTEITITLAELGNPAAIARLNFFNDSSSGLQMVTFDDIRLEPLSLFDGIFADGFETGNTSLWSGTTR